MNVQESVGLSSSHPDVSQRVQGLRDMLAVKRSQANARLEQSFGSAKTATGPLADLSQDPVEQAVATFRKSVQSPDSAEHKNTNVLTPESLANAVNDIASKYNKPVTPQSHETGTPAQPTNIPRAPGKIRALA
jgi:hypothetical protein